MFAHTGQNLPQDPWYASNMEKLGYKLNENNQIVGIDLCKPLIFFHTSNERANETHKESMHECVRVLVKEQLVEPGVVEVYLGGEKGREVLGLEKPQVKHTRIFVTPPEELKKKRNVIVVMGDIYEDVGIWAWRHVFGEGGVDGGTAVGLVKKLAVLGLNAKEEMGKEEPASVPSTTSGSELDAAATAMSKLAIEEAEETPGIVILNPGQLYWSNIENKTMAMATWISRQRMHALGEGYAISRVNNRVDGHSTSFEHIETCMDHILLQLVAPDARLHIVGISRSAELFTRWYGTRQCTTKIPHTTHTDVPGLSSNIKAMAFIQPDYVTSSIKCEVVENTLKERSKEWKKEDPEEVDEMVWPRVMDEALGFFKEMAD